MSKALELIKLCEAMKDYEFLALIFMPNKKWELIKTKDAVIYVNRWIAKSNGYYGNYKVEENTYYRDELIETNNIKLIKIWNELLALKTKAKGSGRITKKEYEANYIPYEEQEELKTQQIAKEQTKPKYIQGI